MVIKSVRVAFSKEPTALSEFDFNELVRETLIRVKCSYKGIVLEPSNPA